MLADEGATDYGLVGAVEVQPWVNVNANEGVGACADRHGTGGEAIGVLRRHANMGQLRCFEGGHAGSGDVFMWGSGDVFM